MLSPTDTCVVKKGFFGSCKEKPVAVCQYCGGPFCQQHGVFLEEDQQVCNRPNCVAKREDVVTHLAYRDAGNALNEQQLCGIAGCEWNIAGRCVRCSVYFCNKHVGAKEELVMEGSVRTRRIATLCQHCVDRRPIWTRM